MKLLIEYNVQCYFARQLVKHKDKGGVNRVNGEIKNKVLFNDSIVKMSSFEDFYSFAN